MEVSSQGPSKLKVSKLSALDHWTTWQSWRRARLGPDRHTIVIQAF